MGWCNDVRSKNYNKEITFPFKHSAEKLYRKDNIYDLFININSLKVLRHFVCFQCKNKVIPRTTPE